MSAQPAIRINKFLSSAGIASRRKADALIAEGKVKVNGKVVTNLGLKIDPGSDSVFVNGKQVAVIDDPLYIVFNKPNDCITTLSDERGRATVMDYVRVKSRIYPIGRLDRKTTGVLLLTNDGLLASRLMHPRSQILKEYQVTLDKPLAQADAAKLSRGVRLSDGMTAPAHIYSHPKSMRAGISIHEGRNRQVHRMFEALGYSVEKLDRVSYAGISYEKLKRGEWRFLTKNEIRSLKHAADIEEPGSPS